MINTGGMSIGMGCAPNPFFSPHSFPESAQIGISQQQIPPHMQANLPMPPSQQQLFMQQQQQQQQHHHHHHQQQEQQLRLAQVVDALSSLSFFFFLSVILVMNVSVKK